MKKVIAICISALVLIAIVAGVFVTAGGHLNVIGYYGYEALDKARAAVGGDPIAAPDGSAIFAQEGSEARMQVDAAPFIDAGLQTDQTMLVFEGPLGQTTIGYHAAMDHFNVALSDGRAAFEWAKDMAANDKDIVFVIDPQWLRDEGVDVEHIEGWAYAQVPVMDEQGKPVDAWKLLKPFDVQ